MKSKQVCKRLFGVFFALLLLVSAVMSGRVILLAFAAEMRYTSALEDLQKDSEFDASVYPDKADDYSIQVIQIAESMGGELFVYTYQPCQKILYLVATEINMSLLADFDDDSTGNSGDSTQGSDSSGGDQSGTAGGGFGGGGGRPFSLSETAVTRLYDLILLRTDGVFCKYKIRDFTVSKDDETRYYNITSIYREWLKGIDTETGNDNTKNAVAFGVGKLYTATTGADGMVSYACKATETIQIINPVAGYLEYSNGFHLYGSWCDSHYVAFSTDKKIDTLMEADVSFVYRSASASYGLGLSGETHYGDPESVVVTLDTDDEGENPADGFLAKKYIWKRIQSVEEFTNDKQNALTDSAKEKLNGQQWVLRFCETARSSITGQTATTSFWTDISEVTVLRLKFMSDGKVYNLGAVSDKVTEGEKPDNTNTYELAGLWEWLARVTGIPQWVWKLIPLLIIIAIALPVLSIIFPAVGQVLLWIVKGIGTLLVWLIKSLWWLICLPFKGIAALVRKIRGE